MMHHIIIGFFNGGSFKRKTLEELINVLCVRSLWVLKNPQRGEKDRLTEEEFCQLQKAYLRIYYA